MRILVTGAEGFTGRHFGATAAAAGHEITPLTADLRDRDAVMREVVAVRPDSAVHLAGISFVGHADERAFYDVNLFGTLNLLDALNAANVTGNVLLASSANVYGNSEDSPLTETTALSPVNHYAMSKVAMEFMAKARAGGLPLVITRPFNYTGVGQSGQFVIPKLIDHFRRRAPQVQLGNLHVEREYNDVRFVCSAYLRLLERTVPAGTYNVCTGNTYELAGVLAVLKRLTGHPMEVVVNSELFRANEIRRLCGDASLLERTVGALPAYSIEQTLSWMLSATA